MKQRLIPIILLLLLTWPLGAQAESRIQIVQLDSSQFPQMSLRLQAEDGQRVPFSLNQMDGLILRENGEIVSNYDLTAVPIGIDLVFVLDVDEASRDHLEIMTGIVERYATQFMSLSELDRVTIIVPNRAYTNGRFLLQNGTTPDAVETAVATYTPPAEPPATAPLPTMLQMGIDHLEESAENGRFQAILLLSEASQLDQLNSDNLLDHIQAADIPLYTAIVGPTATTQQTNNANQLATASRARAIHAPQAAASDSLYLIWQRQATQFQLTYTALGRASGPQIVAVTLGELQHTFTFSLTLLPPELTISLDNVITRQGPAHDTPLADLEPATIEFPITITWPDEKPRRLVELIWTVNEQPQPRPDTLIPDENGQLWLTWPIANVRPDTFEIRAAVRDEWGFSLATPPLLVRIVAERPLPPTPVPQPTPAPGLVETVSTSVVTTLLATGQAAHSLLNLLLGVGLAAIFVLLVRYRRRRQQANAQPTAPLMPPPQPTTTDINGRLPVLELVTHGKGKAHFLPLASDNVTFGRDAQAAEIIFNDRSISPLHARIRYRDNGYWLYDEGSTEGTMLNYERLGLAPRALADGDQIHLGHVHLYFRLLSAAEIAALEEE